MNSPYHMRHIITYTIFTLAAIALCITACTHKPPGPTPVSTDSSGFPAAVGSILINKCAISGCHNAASYQNSAGLLLDTWDHMLDGSVNGAAVIAYNTTYSPLLFFVNTDPANGTVATPTMPLSTTAMPQQPLSSAEYATLRDWIASGAPDKDGNIPFASNADTRQKIYLTQQACDLLAVIDAGRGVVMRYIPIGTDSNNTESPHCVRTSSDGAYAYVSFNNGTSIQKIDTRTDKVVGAVPLGLGSWNIVYIGPGDTTLATTDWVSDGRIVYANARTLQTLPALTGSGSGLFVRPHGIASNAAFDTTFITSQYGNMIYRWAPRVPNYKKISLDANPPEPSNPSDSSSPNPHEIIMSPDYSRYFVSCQGTNEVRVLDAHTNALLAVIPVGTFPQEMAISKTKPYLFVTCTEDAANPLPGRRGSVYVIDYTTNQLVGSPIYGDFYQPHAVTVDDQNGKVYIASLNTNPTGPAPHHATVCFGRAGWYTIYDLNTLQPASSKRYEVTVSPYSAATRFQ